MDPVSAIASIVGIVGFGIQIAQILQAEVDTIQTATERVEQIVIEIRATSTGLTNLQDFLIQDTEASAADRIFNDEGCNEVAHIVRRCNTVFRNITVLVAKAGHGVLSSVDHFQRQVEEEHKKKKKGIKDSNVKLEIELSNLEHLMWPWKLPKIEQHIADLDRLKLSLVLILSVAGLANNKKQKNLNDTDAESEKWEGSQAETLVQDEIFYQDKGLQEAEKKFKILTVGTSPVDRINGRTHIAPEILISNWPNSPSGREICSVTELYESGVILEGFALNPDEYDQTIIEMPLNMHAMQQHALRKRRWGNKQAANVWDSFARLPNNQQEMILEFIAKRKRDFCDYNLSDSPSPPQLVLISLDITKHRWKRFLESIKRLLNTGPSDTRWGPTYFIVIARVTVPRHKGPEPLISTTTPWRPPHDGGDPHGRDQGYDSSDSEYIIIPQRNRSRSRYRTRSRKRYGQSRSRSRSRGSRRSLAPAALAGLTSAGVGLNQNSKSKLSVEERRSRARGSVRRDHYSSNSEHPERSGPVDANAHGVARNEYYYEKAQFPPPPDTKALPYGAPPLRRATTINELDASEPSSALSPQPRHRATMKEGESTEPVIELPAPPRRKTTFQEDTDDDGRSLGGRALAALGIRNVLGTERRSSTQPVRRAEVSSTEASSTHEMPYRMGERISRYRGSSRSRSRQIMPRKSTRRRSSSRRSKGRRTRRSKNREPSITIYHKSPERPIIRTFTDDGIPPTQRDKAAVADYYLKKWTTAYDSVRARNQERRYTVHTTGRSRSRSRSRYNPQPSRRRDQGIIEYGDTPVYGKPGDTSADAYYPSSAYYPPPPVQYKDSNPYQYPLPPPVHYNDSNPYQHKGAYPPADYGIAGTAADVSAGETRERQMEREAERRRRRLHTLQVEDNSRNANEDTQEYRRPHTFGFVASDEEEKEEKPAVSPAGLAVPFSHPAYAESVSDNANGGIEEMC